MRHQYQSASPQLSHDPTHTGAAPASLPLAYALSEAPNADTEPLGTTQNLVPVRADQRRNFLLFHRIQAESLFLFLLSLSLSLDAFSPLSCGAEAEQSD